MSVRIHGVLCSSSSTWSRRPKDRGQMQRDVVNSSFRTIHRAPTRERYQPCTSASWMRSRLQIQYTVRKNEKGRGGDRNRLSEFEN